MMKYSKVILLTAFLALISAGTVLSQTATVTPSQVPQGAYVNGPGGNTDDNFYWQTLAITLAIGADGAGQTITIALPTDVTLADVDMDADPDDEVSFSWSGTGVAAGDFTLNAATSATQIVLNQTIITNAAADWVLNVMFPVETTLTASGSDEYTIDFSDANFTDISTLMVTYRAPGALQIKNFLANISADDDTTRANNYQGLFYPSPAAAFYQAQDDLVKDLVAAETIFSTSAGAFVTEDNNDANDVTYTVWVSTDSTLSHVSEYTEGVTRALNYNTPGDYTQNEGAALTDAMYTGGLPEGAYYYYMTSDLTGDFPLFRSGRLMVIHYPVVNIAGWDRLNDGFDNSGADTDDADVTLDTGDLFKPDGTKATSTGLGQTNVDLYFDVDDLDDNARVYVFYSTTTTLDAEDVVMAGTVPTQTVASLTGATPLVNTLYENMEDMDGFISWNWDVLPVSSSSYISAGDYTLYVVVCDGKHTHFLKAVGTDDLDTEAIKIRHSPSLTFDVLTPYNNGIDEGDAADVTINPSRTPVVMISWAKALGITGDNDLDDSATIKLYIDYDTGNNGLADYGQNDAAAIETAASGAVSPTGTHLIWAGGLEDLEGKDNSWYAWNLKDDFLTTTWYPNTQNELAAAASEFYHLYAVVDEHKTGGNTLVVALGGDGIVDIGENITDIEFDLDLGFVRPLDPPADGITISAEQTYRLNLSGYDLDSNANIGVFLVAATEAINGEIGPETTFVGDTINDLFGMFGVGNGKAYCLTSDEGDHTDGGAAWVTDNSLATTPYYEIAIRQAADGAAKYTDDVLASGVPLADGEYWVYVGIDDGSYKTITLTLGSVAAVEEFTVGSTFTASSGATGTVISTDTTGPSIIVHYHGPTIAAAVNVVNDVSGYSAAVAGVAAAAARTGFTAANVPLYRAPGTITIVNSGAEPPVKNLTINPMSVSVAEGETVTFSVYGSDNAGTIDFADVYVAVEKEYWTLVNGVTPFTVDPSFTGLMIANQVIDDDGNGRWIFRGTLNNNGTTIDLNNTVGEALMTFQLVSKGTTASSGETSSIYYVNEPAQGWVTKFRNNGNVVAVNTQAGAFTVVPRAIVEGIVDLEGRTTNAVTMTLELRDRGSYEVYTDAIFTAANDANLTTDGIQIVLDTQGKFTLTKVPAGEWDLVAVYPRYLAALRSIEPKGGVDSLFVDFGTLLGGDAYGYTDSLSYVYPDNEVASNDVNRINTAFLATSLNANWSNANNWQWADVNEDGVVEEDDLAIATGNVGATGAQPVFKPASTPIGSNLAASVEFMNVPVQLRAGETYSIEVFARNAVSVRAYYINMNYDTTKLSLVDIRDGGFLNASSYSFPVFEEEGSVGFVNALYSKSAVAGDGVLAEVTFTALEDGLFSEDMLGLTRASFVNADLVKEFVIDTPTGVVDNSNPTVFALGQNFPNPFNPTTTIGYTLPEDGIVTVKVYDILGRHVTTLVDGQRAAGNYSVMWNATDLDGRVVSAGVYFYTIKAGSFSDTKRMLLLK